MWENLSVFIMSVIANIVILENIIWKTGVSFSKRHLDLGSNSSLDFVLLCWNEYCITYPVKIPIGSC